MDFRVDGSPPFDPGTDSFVEDSGFADGSSGLGVGVSSSLDHHRGVSSDVGHVLSFILTARSRLGGTSSESLTFSFKISFFPIVLL